MPLIAGKNKRQHSSSLFHLPSHDHRTTIRILQVFRSKNIMAKRFIRSALFRYFSVGICVGSVIYVVSLRVLYVFRVCSRKIHSFCLDKMSKLYSHTTGHFRKGFHCNVPISINKIFSCISKCLNVLFYPLHLLTIS